MSNYLDVFSLKGKVSIVTGGGRGIGPSTSEGSSGRSGRRAHHNRIVRDGHVPDPLPRRAATLADTDAIVALLPRRAAFDEEIVRCGKPP